ncbi:uncharacterized protein BT62DRAFT_1003395 [Guyanagaster necrorhizus]|uniref:Uncharacterized protein n=1 Tax=Guyanagaster necrorhizus TaxID=856835 RepID=A0A9P8AUP4_9AGAR|nr:uncharacterized protein BT62DRAFT_1003395 [Guyanagaster necrorhizus MCA 3950]KAG7448683.1 hypothetical protein BT62DRAFT_1003395 [Guyanagaster necrorhizus MCA 3950]
MAFAMATSIEGPSDPTDNDKARIFQFVNAQLNSQILYVLLYAAISKVHSYLIFDSLVAYQTSSVGTCTHDARWQGGGGSYAPKMTVMKETNMLSTDLSTDLEMDIEAQPERRGELMTWRSSNDSSLVNALQAGRTSGSCDRKTKTVNFMSPTEAPTGQYESQHLIDAAFQGYFVLQNLGSCFNSTQSSADIHFG